MLYIFLITILIAFCPIIMAILDGLRPNRRPSDGAVYPFLMFYSIPLAFIFMVVASTIKAIL